MVPKVSVIITIYNREKYIEDCARSLFEQTLDDVELLFVDDASTDDSVMILRRLLVNYPKRKELTRIICLEENGGRAVARQTGIDHSTGEYVIHVDSDDWVERNYIEELLNEAENTGADITGCNLIYEFSDHSENIKNILPCDSESALIDLLHGKICGWLVLKLFKTSLFIRNKN